MLNCLQRNDLFLLRIKPTAKASFGKRHEDLHFLVTICPPVKLVLALPAERRHVFRGMSGMLAETQKDD